MLYILLRWLAQSLMVSGARFRDTNSKVEPEPLDIVCALCALPRGNILSISIIEDQRMIQQCV
jgi:hypothetical protein